MMEKADALAHATLRASYLETLHTEVSLRYEQTRRLLRRVERQVAEERRRSRPPHRANGHGSLPDSAHKRSLEAAVRLVRRCEDLCREPIPHDAGWEQFGAANDLLVWILACPRRREAGTLGLARDLLSALSVLGCVARYPESSEFADCARELDLQLLAEAGERWEDG